MPVRFQHAQNYNSFYFVTFTCYKWLQLFDIAKAYGTVYKWFDHLFRNNTYVTGYVIMPNHVHVLLYFPQMSKSLIPSARVRWFSFFRPPGVFTEVLRMGGETPGHGIESGLVVLSFPLQTSLRRGTKQRR